MKAKYKECILQWTSGTGEMAPWVTSRTEQAWSPERIPRLPVPVEKENTTKLSYRLHMCTVEHAPPTTLDSHMHNNKIFSKMLNEYPLKDIFKVLKHKLGVKPQKKKSSTIHLLAIHFQSLADIFKYQRPQCTLQSLPSFEKSDDFPGESLLFWSSALNVTKLKKWCGFFVFLEISIFYQLRFKFLCQALLTLKCRKACLADFYTKAERQERQLSDW